METNIPKITPKNNFQYAVYIIVVGLFTYFAASEVSININLTYNDYRATETTTPVAPQTHLLHIPIPEIKPK